MQRNVKKFSLKAHYAGEINIHPLEAFSGEALATTQIQFGYVWYCVPGPYEAESQRSQKDHEREN